MIAVNWLADGALAAPADETGGGMGDYGDYLQRGTMQKERVSWSQRMLWPSINIGEVLFFILGTHKAGNACPPYLTTPPLMEDLGVHLPGAACDSIYWLKNSWLRDGASLTSMESNVGYSSILLWQ